jgi:hypothetical protein
MTRSIVADAKTLAGFVGGLCARLARIVALIGRLAATPADRPVPHPSPVIPSTLPPPIIPAK